MTSVQRVLKVMGGARVLGKSVAGSPDLFPVVGLIQKGFPFEAIDWLSRSLGIERARVLEVIGLPLRTYARRKEEGRLGVFESDRLYRLARVVADAIAVLGTPEKASRWLQKKNRSLGDRVPLDLLSTDIGAHEVERMIGRIHHGVFS